MTDRIGQQLGNYRLTRLLGHGGFADVYLGEHIYLKTQAAIKVLRTQLSSDMKEVFLAEARTIARLAHPHIVRVLDFGIENTLPFLVMEYAPNGTLRQHHVRGTRLPMSVIVPYIKQMAAALQHAHDQRLIHRDVKPENMLLGRDYEVLLSDFGIATLAQTSRSLHSQDISGTVAYMAPEQLQGKARPASDQYSLAIIVYEWLTGQCPFQGTFTEIASQHMFSAPASLRGPSSTISPEVEQVVMIALAKNPEARFARVEAFASALEQASQPELTTLFTSDSGPTFISPLSAPPLVIAPVAEPPVFVAQSDAGPTYISAPPPYVPVPISYQRNSVEAPSSRPPQASPETSISTSTDKLSRRGRSRRVLIGGLVGVAFATGSGITWLALSHIISPPKTTATSTPGPTATAHTYPSPQPDPTMSNSTTPGPNPPQPLVYRGPYQEFAVAWSPGGNRIACAGAGSIIQVLSSANGDLLLSLNSGSNIVYSVAWSPDRQYIASGHDDGSVRVWDANNGRLLQTLTGHTSQVNSVAWSPDSKKVVSGSGDKTAKVWNVTGGTVLFTYTGHAHYVNAVAWSPDGTRIVSGSGNHTDNHNAQVWDASNGTLYYTFNGHSDEVLALAWSPAGSRIASASDDGTVKIWDVANGAIYVNYAHHAGYVVAVSWSPDGKFIASAGVDTTVQVWDAFSGNTVNTYTGHTAEVEDVAWAPDSMRVASASRDMTVQVWKAF